MSNKKRPGGVSAGRKDKSSNTRKNTADLLKTQSPWAAVPENNWEAELLARLENDADRAEATAADDRRWFEAHPGRRFHLREATPHERYIGFSDALVVTAGRPIKFAVGHTYDLRKYDNDTYGKAVTHQWLDGLLESEGPDIMAAVKKMRKALRGARHG